MDFEIRDFQTLEEFRECVALQEAVWGEGFSERVPVAILRVAQRLGGVAAGAYDSRGRLVAFVFGLTGIQDDGPVHWSDMLAVRPGLRNSGLGRRLKLYQREVLLAAGVPKMLWSFDPLESRNAHLNLERLGVVVREYVRDMYGESDSPLHRGIGTDRLIALWELDAPRVRRRIEDRDQAASGAHEDGVVVVLDAQVSEGIDPIPGEPRLEEDARRISVAIPADIHGIRERNLELARRWREATRSALDHYLARGWEVQGLTRSGTLSWYLLVLQQPFRVEARWRSRRSARP
jgi:predicted GNAT superfamily acetyltransferase